jgi:hypothetical protein
MTFHNPWIDPRVVEVTSAAARAYLERTGWKLLPEEGTMLHFEGPPGGGEGPTVWVPVNAQARDYTQRVIELITDLAIAEGRYAVEILNDILRQSAEPRHANGPTVAAKAEAGRK